MWQIPQQAAGLLPTQSPVLTHDRALNITLLTLFAFPTDQGHSIIKTSRLSQESKCYSICLMVHTNMDFTSIHYSLLSCQMLRCLLLSRRIWHKQQNTCQKPQHKAHASNYTVLLSQEGKPWILSGSTGSNTYTHAEAPDVCWYSATALTQRNISEVLTCNTCDALMSYVRNVHVGFMWRAGQTLRHILCCHTDTTRGMCVSVFHMNVI